MNCYKNKYRYLGKITRTETIYKLENHFLDNKDYIDGWNYIDAWLIMKWENNERKYYFWDNIWDRNILKGLKTTPWKVDGIWPDLPEDNYYKKQIRYIQENYPDVFCYESQHDNL